MATAEARYYHDLYGLPCIFANKLTRKVFWSEVFENNPKILKEPEGQEVVVIENYPSRRPYVARVTPERFYFDHNFSAEPGEIFLTEEEKAKGIPGAVIVEPHTKLELGLSRNKAWPWDRWQTLVREVKAPWIQLGPKGTKILEGVRHIETPRFRDALGYINSADLVVTTDGALHHAAAALDRDAVVLWGGVTDPQTLGYQSHRNIRAQVQTCGSIKDCAHCHDAMERISLEEVAEAVDGLLRVPQREEAAGQLVGGVCPVG